ncbi:zinc finger protein 30 homolog [Octodon degus]|uniref:Zinc finger protein 30 homolog n=1 Tax=Octodon degus TaxID=10160 RepID=A0A6P6D8V3_OCTDE|nr:zinc finger protein 30 homolog [Octodon degus]XP_023556521.1 zinc finger protein 30 homolog [Octodon degus]XP_023556523.1 zinc finger protein 30 homolog [Octodon degus]
MMAGVSKPKDLEILDDVEMPFSENEWASLTSVGNALYAEVMAENCKTVASLAAASIDRPDANLALEEERDALIQRGWEVGLAEYITKLRRYTRLIYRHFIQYDERFLEILSVEQTRQKLVVDLF